MGINGLLPLLKSIHKPCNLKKFAGQTLAVDAYGWLHRGTVACAVELAMGSPTRKFVDFAMHRVRMLQHFGVTPFLVFDGDYLPSKAATESDREKRREAAKVLGLQLLRAGKASQAHLELQKAVDVTPEMARQLIDELKMTGVQYIVAPYEADAQMVYLERKGIVDGIISEDSDLLVFGAKRLLTKLDQYGNCIEINKADFCACREINLTGWTDTEFRRMAILSGCDYLASINNMGLKTAYRMVRKHKTIEKILRMLQFDGKFHIPKDYLDNFYQAELTFLHQRVYCPINNLLVYHTQPDQTIDDEKMPFIGAHVESHIAKGVAMGDLNPMTKMPIIVEQSSSLTTPRSQWSTPRPQPRRSISSVDMKKGVSIDTFFKARRVPLAELDPNCFTPSPSQQDALMRNNGPWMSEPVPRPYLSRSTTEPEPQLPQSVPAPIRSQNGRALPWSASPSEPRPQKRARLCADDDMIGSPIEGLKVNLGRSRFFDDVPESSPLLGRTTKSRRTVRDDINIYSDDSIEEALLSLPDFDGFKAGSKTTQKIAVFDEEVVKAEASQTILGHSATELHQTNSNEASQLSVPTLTQSTSITSSEEGPLTPTTTTTSKVTGLREKFAFTSSVSSSSSGSINKVPTPLSSKLSRIPLAIKSASVKPVPSRVFSPLQNLGTKALMNSTHAPATPLYSAASRPARPHATTFNSSSPSFKKLDFRGSPFPEVSRSLLPELAMPLEVQPADIPLPAQDNTELSALGLDSEITDENGVGVGERNKGSEDLIIHDSEEDEDEMLSPVVKDSAKLNLSRFAFSA